MRIGNDSKELSNMNEQGSNSVPKITSQIPEKCQTSHIFTKEIFPLPR